VFWEDFRREGMTSFAGTPDLYRILDQLGFADWNLPALRYFTQAGGALEPALVRKFASDARDLGAQFFVMYGQTEATARISYLPPELAFESAGSIGKAVPGGSLCIDKDTCELLYSGPNVFAGYAESAADLISFAPEPILRTGDIATQDADGMFRITGRIKRFVKLFGRRVSLDELSGLLAERMPGTRFECVGLPGERIGVIHTRAGLDVGGIESCLRAHVPIRGGSVVSCFVDTIPSTSSGKPDYPTMQELAQSADSARAIPAGSGDG
jgi:acyl-coenzyme A synthetase/AMP-(fatty) acid ligase